MDSLLQSVASGGTAAKAQSTLKRNDIYGKTGTTNDSLDAWFAGFQPTMAAVAWMGYDTPRKLGDRETGGGLSLPIWISYMETALKGVPVSDLGPPPAGVMNIGGELYYDDFGPGRGVASLGVEQAPPQPVEVVPGGVPAGTPPAPEERNRILDLFRN
jgi:penicillin-binding protein 1A